MKTIRKIGERDKNKKKISSPPKGRISPKANKDEVCFAPEEVQQEQLCCCEIECCC
jgi:hypothetical protein